VSVHVWFSAVVVEIGSGFEHIRCRNLMATVQAWSRVALLLTVKQLTGSGSLLAVHVHFERLDRRLNRGEKTLFSWPEIFFRIFL